MMNPIKSLTISAGLVVGLAAPLAGHSPEPVNPGANATARFLAGIPQAEVSVLSRWESIPAWREHRTQSSALWKQWNGGRALAMRRWAQSEAAAANPVGGTLFYPFSGPDIPSALAFFPEAAEYVLIGLEPVGRAPDLAAIPAEALPAYLANLRKATDELIQLSFFRTNDMAVDMEQIGVTPILMLSLVQAGYTVEEVNRIAIAPNGHLRRGEAGTPGVEIRFRKGRQAPQVVRYFSMDLSNNGLSGTKAAGARAYLGSLRSPTTFLKAASYLMHKPYFSQVRSVILDRSAYVLQDDSGIPFRFFPSQSWSTRLYGSYTAPITLFDNWRQADLQTAYGSPGVRTLPFGIGYRHRPGTSNLMLSVRKPEQSLSWRQR